MHPGSDALVHRHKIIRASLSYSSITWVFLIDVRNFRSRYQTPRVAIRSRNENETLAFTTHGEFLNVAIRSAIVQHKVGKA